MKSSRSANPRRPQGRSPYGERGLKYRRHQLRALRPGRSPYGERGLKSHQRRPLTPTASRSPYGERGLKSHAADQGADGWRRSPYGERGLKSEAYGVVGDTSMSLSLRRAWIEISSNLTALPAG